MDHALEDIDHVLDDIGGCSMGDSSTMDVAMDDVESMHGLLDLLVDAHANHADVADCMTEAGGHEGDMDEVIEGLEGHHDMWHDDTSMMCEAHEDDDETDDEH
jgi:hypothetical protein